MRHEWYEEEKLIEHSCGLGFKVVEISTAVFSLNKQICCTYENTSKKIQETIYFIFL